MVTIIASVVVALITGGCGLIGSFMVARTSSDKVVAEVKLNQAVQDEKINNYQRVTNENIKDLRDQVQSQNAWQTEWGTRIALLEAEVRQMKGDKS